MYFVYIFDVFSVLVIFKKIFIGLFLVDFNVLIEKIYKFD